MNNNLRAEVIRKQVRREAKLGIKAVPHRTDEEKKTLNKAWKKVLRAPFNATDSKQHAAIAGKARWLKYRENPALLLKSRISNRKAARKRWGKDLWSPEDDKLIMVEGYSVAELAQILKRSKPAISMRRYRLRNPS